MWAVRAGWGGAHRAGGESLPLRNTCVCEIVCSPASFLLPTGWKTGDLQLSFVHKLCAVAAAYQGSEGKGTGFVAGTNLQVHPPS